MAGSVFVQMRDFPEATEKTARLWRDIVVSSEDWRVERDIGIGESQPFFVSCGPVSGVGKPGRKDVAGQEAYRAANEKIASDLAFDLQLPVPPVVLWRRLDGPRAGKEALTCISAFPFTPLFSWRSVTGDQQLLADFTSYLIPFASAMAAFDTWVDNRDRPNDGNLVVQGDRLDPGRFRAAYIDYSYCLAHSWGENEEWSKPTAVRCYPDVVSPALDRMEESIINIQSLAPDRIREIVDRIPEDFLRSSLKGNVAGGLLHRQKYLRDYLRVQYAGLP